MRFTDSIISCVLRMDITNHRTHADVVSVEGNVSVTMQGHAQASSHSTNSSRTEFIVNLYNLSLTSQFPLSNIPFILSFLKCIFFITDFQLISIKYNVY